jgi:ATP-dependent protease Clp ATPase subunit
VYTNTVVVTNFVPTIIERTNVVLATNELSGEVIGQVVREPVATNFVELVQTNYVRVFETNFVSVPVTNLVAQPGAESMIQGAAMITNTLAPGLGSLVALALGGLYHGYRQVRNRKVNEALVQGVETARAILETTPQGQAADAQFVRWLMEHQKEAGIFTVV